MDKVQETRPPDKASPGDPEQLEREPPEQQVTVRLVLEQRAGEEEQELGRRGVLN